MSFPNRDFNKAKATYKPTTFSDEEIKKKLEGYYNLPTDTWDKLPNSCWYRYHSNGVFKTGGFLIKTDKEFFVFKNLSKNYTWSVNRDSVQALWFKPRKHKKKVGEFYSKFIKDNLILEAFYPNDVML